MQKQNMTRKTMKEGSPDITQDQNTTCKTTKEGSPEIMQN